MVHLSPKKLILFGAACSPVTDQIAKAARHWNLVQLTYADTHPMFTEKSFPHFYRVVPSENEFNPPRLSLLRYFNWTRVGTLYQNSAKYALVRDNFQLALLCMCCSKNIVCILLAIRNQEFLLEGYRSLAGFILLKKVSLLGQVCCMYFVLNSLDSNFGQFSYGFWQHLYDWLVLDSY